MKSPDKTLSPDATDAEISALLQKTNEQYRVYKEINDVVNIVRKPAFSPPPAPTPERPLIFSGFANRK